MKVVDIYTDGACSGNPGPGGWGAILRYNNVEKEISGSSEYTTNNRMELTAAIEALKILKEPCEVNLYSDSKYLVDSFTLGWVYNWQKNNFIKKGKDVLNSDLFKELLELFKIHKVNLHWVKGHSENEFNNRCDKLAVKERSKYK